MAFLVHIDIMGMFVYSLTYTLELNNLVIVRDKKICLLVREPQTLIDDVLFQSYYWVGMVMISYGGSFVGALLVEAPFISLEKLLIRRKLFDIFGLHLILSSIFCPSRFSRLDQKPRQGQPSNGREIG